MHNKHQGFLSLLSYIRCVAKFFSNFQRASLACFALLGTLLVVPLQAAEFPTAVLAIVVDDVGYNLAQAERLLKMEGKLTLGILPFAPHSPAIARRAQIAGKEIILHQPMEPIAASHTHSERGTLTMQMSAEHFNQHFADALAAVPYAVGVNNHTGSLLTEHREVERPVDQQENRAGRAAAREVVEHERDGEREPGEQL